LVAILATPPLTTSGRRSRDRVALVAALLGFDSHSIVNLVETATEDITRLATVGAADVVWLESRPAIESAARKADGALFAWGHSEPSGIARKHHRDQVEWVLSQVRQLDLPWWTVGTTPRHPSRWQRYTSRAFPGERFDEALFKSLRANHLVPLSRIAGSPAR